MLRVGRALASGALPLAALRAQLGRGPIAVSGVPSRLAGQIVRFGAVGVASTLAYLLIFLLLRGGLGAQPANLTALLLTAVANTAANRRFTFGLRGAGAGRHQLQGLLVFALGLGLTSGALALTSALVSHPSRTLEVSVLVAANLAATVLRFVLFREWIFRSRPPPDHLFGELTWLLPMRRRRDPRQRSARRSPDPGCAEQCAGLVEHARLGATVRSRLTAGHGSAVSLAAQRVRIRQRLLRRGGAGRHEELEGDRSSGRWTRPISSPSTSRRCPSVAGRDRRTAVRLQLLDAARSPGPGRCCGSGPAVPDGEVLVRPGGRNTGRGIACDHSRRGADVQVQQPGRADDAAPRRRRLRHDPGGRRGTAAVAAAGRCRDRVRLPHQGACSRSLVLPALRALLLPRRAGFGAAPSHPVACWWSR